MVQLLKPEACNQTVLQDRSLLVRLKLVENAKIEKIDEFFSIQMRYFLVFFKHCVTMYSYESACIFVSSRCGMVEMFY